MKSSRLSTSSTTSSSTATTTGSRLLSPAKQELTPIDFDTEKELQKQIEEIVGEFKQKDSKDWSFRYKALVQLQRVVMGNGAEMKSFPQLLRYLSVSLIEQLTEVRSTIVKEACMAVELMASRLKVRFEPFSLQYLQVLLKIVVVKVAIVAEAAHNAIKSMIMNIQTKSIIPLLMTSSSDQHNEQLRRRSGEYILMILYRAIEEPGMILMSNVPQLEQAITKLLVDGGSDIRATARLAFWTYCELAEERAMSMLYEYTPTTQKNLFTMLDQLTPTQQEIANRIHQSLLDENQTQQLMTESTDLDLDLMDFKKKENSTTSTTTTTSGIRAKTPTGSGAGGRASGLKSRVSTSTTSPTSSTTSTTSTSGIPRRSGSSLGMNSTISSSTLSSSIKRQDPSTIIRSKSSLGTTRSMVTGSSSSTSSPSGLPKTTSSSPNTSSTNLSGRYSSIGSRIPTSASSGSSTTGKPSLSQTLKSSQIKSALVAASSESKKPPASLTKSSPSNSSNSLTSSMSTPKSQPMAGTESTSRLSKSTSTPSTTSTTAVKKTTTTTTTTATTTKKSTSPSSTRSTTPTSTTASLSKSTATSQPSLMKTKQLGGSSSTLTKSIATSNPSRKIESATSTTTDDFEKELNENDLMSHLNELNQLSEAFANNLRDAKKGLSLIDQQQQDELTLDDLQTDQDLVNDSVNSNSRNGKSLKSSNDDEFNWIEDSVDQTLIEDDILEFDDNYNNNKSGLIMDDDDDDLFINSNSNNNSNNNSKRNSLNFDDDLEIKE